MDLVLRGLHKSFGGLRAVHDVSLTVRARAIFGLIGPNGAGKTTVFNLVTGVYRCDAGSIRFGEADLAHLAPAAIAAAGVARTFQNVRLFAQLTARENLLVAAEVHKRAGLAAAVLRSKAHFADEGVMHARAASLLDVFGLTSHAEAPAASLPYGDQRRLEIARAMMIEPKLLLLDEPAAGMNTREAAGLMDQIRWLRDTFAVSVVLVEHNMQVVMGVCEEIHVLDHGETIATGLPAAIRADPKVLAAYLGEEDGAPEASPAPAASIRVAHPTRPAARREAGVPLLALDGVRIRYGGIEAVKGISLHVEEGEIVALLGANGAGKTSALKAIARLVPLAAGSLRYGGRDVTALSTEEVVRAGVSLVPEGRAIFAGLTVRENLELGAYGHRDRAVMAQTIDDVVALFPRLGERMRQDAATLSGGEQQMLAIGRALMARPSLLLLDEPSLGIAPKLVTQIFDAIRAIAASGVAILLVEQNTRVALATSRRAYVLRTGELALEGESARLVEHPEIQAAYLGG